MVKCLPWLFWTYLTLKLIQLTFGSRPVAPDASLTFRSRLLRGEPILFAVAVALSVLAVLWSSWYVQRGYARALDRAIDCYGRLRAVDELPILRGRFDAYRLFQAVEGDETAASIAAQALDIRPARLSAALADKMRFHSQRYAALARSDRRQAPAEEVAAIARCLKEPPLNL